MNGLTDDWDDNNHLIRFWGFIVITKWQWSCVVVECVSCTLTTVNVNAGVCCTEQHLIWTVSSRFDRNVCMCVLPTFGFVIEKRRGVSLDANWLFSQSVRFFSDVVHICHNVMWFMSWWSESRNWYKTSSSYFAFWKKKQHSRHYFNQYVPVSAADLIFHIKYFIL